MRVVPVEVLERFLNNFNKHCIKKLKKGTQVIMTRENIAHLFNIFINEYSIEIKEE